MLACLDEVIVASSASVNVSTPVECRRARENWNPVGDAPVTASPIEG